MEKDLTMIDAIRKKALKNIPEAAIQHVFL